MPTDENALVLQIFPAEVWLRIFEHVKTATDYQNFCSASPYFRGLLFPRATQILFPEVAKLVLHQVQRQIEDVLQNRPLPEKFYLFLKRDQVVIRSFSKNLLVRHVIPYRKVCKAWRQGVDNVLQTQHFNLNFPSDYEKFSKISEGCLDKNFERFFVSQDFIKFEEHFDCTHLDAKVNPFLSRGVALILGENEENTEPVQHFYQPCIQFLGKYGFHIWSCAIKFYEKSLRRATVLKFYQNLKVFLKLMPNLKTLKVEMFYEISYTSLQGLLDADMSHNPFPTLNHFRLLTTSGVHFTAVQAILQANPQVEHVDARGKCPPSVLNAILKEAKLLKGLALRPGIRDELDAICNAEVTSPAENLWLDASGIVAQGQQHHWQEIFSGIESPFSQSLKQLRVTLPMCLTLRSDGELALPHLQILELEMEELVPIDFILPMKDTLKQLSVRTFNSQTSNQMARRRLSSVKLCEFWDRLEMSNVWEFFPELKLLRTGNAKRSKNVRWNTCTRCQWNMHKQHSNLQCYNSNP